ncbi:cytochrome c biogenesis CcdA family protein [Glycomyces sp. L485]|uniref:cytochrome c biogenesis CcdA family protein n=1 Tax=Glycomyces sp. L485 TaxID=2909235 RepID=UPI001F4AB194|nr:cytochrome c biogenesis CcdA family protein [Glycomyces sp. L485]MCH7231469.1 cytochrome c biogenesis CcdA family protein [Glycomyces sp. L485]
MQDLPFAFALIAGAVAAVNPCGFALLPVYAGFLITGEADEDVSRWRALGRAGLFTVAMTIGFVTVFGAFGLLVSTAAVGITGFLPWVTIVVGAAVALAGVWLLLGRGLPTFMPKLGGREVKRSLGSMTLFGLFFALASLSCTIAPFLALVAQTFRSTSVLGGTAMFLAYALGMTIVIGVVSLAIALAREGLIVWLKRQFPKVMRVVGVLLLAAGLYVAYYGWWDLRVLGGGDPSDPVIEGALSVQRFLEELVKSVFGR